MNSAAKVISVLLHPLLMPTYLFLILILEEPFYFMLDSSRLRFVFFIFGLTFVVPSWFIIILRQIRLISSYTMTTKKERIIPILVIIIIYAVALMLFSFNSDLNYYSNFLKIYFVILTILIECLLITLVYKISIHSFGICGVVGILGYVSYSSGSPSLLFLTLIVSIVAGIVMSARLYLNAHSINEVLLGGAMGLLTGILGMAFL